MEEGGNAKINAIFEANLARSGRTKPTNLADGPTRERYIRDKYERRKFYDPAGFSFNSGSAAPVAGGTTGAGCSEVQVRPGAPSDIARRRVANRQAKMKPPNVATREARTVRTTKVAQAPVSAPVDFDLLDFGSPTTTTPAPATNARGGGDVFSSPLVPAAAAPTNQVTQGALKNAIPPPPKSAPQATTPATLAEELMKNPAPVATKTTTSNDDILALFGSPKPKQNQPQSGFGMQAMNQMGPGGGFNANSMTSMNGMMPQQHVNMNAFGNRQNMMTQQQHQQMMMMQNNNNVNNMMPNSNQAMANQMMQQQMMMQRQMMMMKQQQQMQNQFQMNNAGAMNNTNMFNSPNGMNNSMGRMANNNNHMNSAIKGMQNMNMGNNIASSQSSDDGGFGTPMGGSSQQQTMKDDAFSSLGGMNAFR